MTDKVQAALAQLASTATAAPLPNRCVGANCPGLQWGWASPYINTVISSPQPPRPLRYIVNTNDAAEHVGGNAQDRRERLLPARRRIRRRRGHQRPAARRSSRTRTCSTRMSASVNKQPPALPEAAWPTDTFFDELHKLPEYINGEAVIVYHAPAADHRRRQPGVLPPLRGDHAGSLFSTVSYPVIDLARRAASIQGVIDGLNQILDLAVAEYRAQGGTWIIPEPRPAVGHRRRRLLSQHAGDDSRPRAGPEEQGA